MIHRVTTMDLVQAIDEVFQLNKPMSIEKSYV